jgi:hypothetical protein
MVKVRVQEQNISYHFGTLTMSARGAYYRHLYPFKAVREWLEASEYVSGVREYAFRFDSGAMTRYMNFSTTEAFMKTVQKANPAEIHLGGIYVRAEIVILVFYFIYETEWQHLRADGTRQRIRHRHRY